MTARPNFTWVSNTKSRRDKLTADQLAALTKLGVDWA
ncbi:helicase [Streptomyces xiamenensis]